MRLTTTCAAITIGLCCTAFLNSQASGQNPPHPDTGAGEKTFHWPQGKRAALSLSFDDARLSQIDTGLELLNKCGVHVTFYVNPNGVEKRLEGWKRVVASGHEIGNHTMTHPCTGNFDWSRDNALENHFLQMIAKEMDDENAEIQRVLGVKPTTFAYPCGQKFVGRGRAVKSYVPLVAERFIVGRGYYDEPTNDPVFTDLAQATGTTFDDMDYIQMIKLVSKAADEGRWLIFVGHEIGERGFQITDTTALQALCKYALDPANGLWVDTVDNVGKYILEQRAGSNK